MKARLNTLMMVAFFLAVILGAACSRSPSYYGEDKRIPAHTLKGATPAYLAFSAYLGKSPPPNEFARFASNPDNYTIIITNREDEVVYTFVLNPYKGKPPLDGMISFSWNKESEVVEPTKSPW